MIRCEICEEYVDDFDAVSTESGDYCETCYMNIECRACRGQGKIRVCRDAQGNIDYLKGRPTSERVTCDSCKGEGVCL